MPSGNAILFDDVYDEMLREAYSLPNPNEYYTILYDSKRPCAVLYNNGDLYKFSFEWGGYIKCMPVRDLEVNQF
jgi:hypothetical protein